MTTIALIDGIRIQMFANDHPPPHFHARCGEFEAMISIATGDVLEGLLPRAKLRIIRTWFVPAPGGAGLRMDGDPGAPIPEGFDLMRSYAITSVEAVRYPVVRVVFEDGLAGEIDMSDSIAQGEMFAPLKDPEYFKTVAVGALGGSFGWNLDTEFEEIDYCADAARIDIETRKVTEMAERFRQRSEAAE